MGAVPHEAGAPRLTPSLRLISANFAGTDEPVSPELALIDVSLRNRLIGELHEPGAFRPHPPLPTAPVPERPRTDGSPPSGGYASAPHLTSVLEMGGRTWGLPTVIGVAVAFATAGFAAGHIGHRARIAAPAPSTTGAPPPTVDAASRPTPKTASPRNTHTPLAPRHAATSAEGPGRTFAWVASIGVRSYEVQFFRGAKRVLARRVNVPRIILPSRWTYAGRNETLRPGTYRWYVWPLRGNPASRARKPVVQASFKIAQPG